jgi:hypothetical protein
MGKGIIRISASGILSTIALLAFVALIFSVSVAQTTGNLYGQVSDPSGSAVQDASVTATNLGTGLVRNAVSNHEGSYLVPSLPPGPYRLAFQHSGFKTLTQTGVIVIVGENARVDASLQVGAVGESVNVSANAVGVDTESSTVGSTVDDLRIAELPLNGRNVLELVQLQPGVGQTQNLNAVTTNARSGPLISVSGNRENQNNTEMDGTFLQEQWINIGVNLGSPDSTEEFRVLTNTYDAQYGRASGGVLLSVTKAGTNQFHGNLFEYIRNDAFDARNYFATGAKPELRQNQFGGSIGGPVRLPFYNGKDRTFFFFNYQGSRIHQQGLVASFPPSADERQGIFSTPVTDPQTGQPFPNNTIPSDRFDPMSVSILAKYIPVPNQPNGESLLLEPTPTSDNQYTLRVDQNLTSTDQLKFRWFRDNASMGNFNLGNIINVGMSELNLVDTESLTYTKTITPKLLNEALFSIARTNWSWAPIVSESPKDLGGNYNENGPFNLLPAAIVAGGGVSITFLPAFFVQNPERTFQIGDNLTWTLGRHALRFGTTIELLRINTLVQSPPGISVFLSIPAPTFTGNAWADFLLGHPFVWSDGSYSTAGDARDYRTDFYAQDDIKFNSRLTLNLGLRYELAPFWWPANGEGSTFSLPAYNRGQQSTIFPSAPLGMVFVGDRGFNRALVNTDKKDFYPRIGLAWDPTGKGRTAIRAAYGVFGTATGSYQSIGGGAPYAFNASLVGPSFSDPWNIKGGGRDPFPFTFNPANVSFPLPMGAGSFQEGLANGNVQQYNLNIQHQFGENWVLQTGYVGSRGTHLSALRDMNQALYATGASELNIQQRRPFRPDLYQNIIERTSANNSHYNSLQTNLQKRFSHGYTVQVAYTYSKSIDDLGTAANDALVVQDSNNPLRGMRGLSDFDQRHIVAGNFIWEIPFLKRNRFLGGWEISDITRYTTGLPFSIYCGCDPALIGALTFGFPQRANQVGDPNLDPNRSHTALTKEYFNTAAFAVPPPTGSFGNSGRNIVIGPGFAQTDVSLHKKFVLGEKMGNFQFRADFFNLFNQVNFRNPLNTVGSPGFGQIVSANPARIIQLALRYDF